MSTTTTPTATARDVRRRATAALLAVLLAAATALVALPAPRAAGADDRGRHWAGFHIPRTGHAAGGWIGGYRVDGTPVFVITPGRRPNRAGFRPADATSDLRGSKGPSGAATERAAWILSKYGGHKDAVQAAAVDAAVLHLLGGRAWRFGAPRGAARIRSSGDPATVRRYVRLMLRGSRASAGPHQVAVVATTADVGGVTGVTVSVTDGHGGPVAGLPVRVTSPDGGPSQPAAGPIDTVTGDDGRAVVRLAAPLAGWRTVVAEVGQVPLHWLRVRRADRKRQASAAEGGVRRTIVASARVAVRGPQSLTLAAVPDRRSWSAPRPGSSATVARRRRQPRGATAALHGPFASASAATCSGPAVATVVDAGARRRRLRLPAVRRRRGATTPGASPSTAPTPVVPAASCGAPVQGARPTDGVGLRAPTSAARSTVSVRPRSRRRAALRRAGRRHDSSSTGRTTRPPGLHGNHRDVVQRRPGNGTFASLSFQVEADRRPWYAWRVLCGAPAETQVSP